jgi:hypothetical protein
MKTILETDSDFICDIQALCFQMLLPEEAELVKASKTRVLFRVGLRYGMGKVIFHGIKSRIACYAG